MLMQQVESGELTPIGERLPQHPYQIPLDTTGEYGGKLTVNHFILQGHLWTYNQDQGELYSVPQEVIIPSQELFESVEFSDNYTTIRFRLRAGTKWSDGAPFTVEDVEFAYNNVIMNSTLLPQTPSFWKGSQLTIDENEPLNFELSFAEPKPDFFVTYGIHDQFMRDPEQLPYYLPSHFIKGEGDSFNRESFGTRMRNAAKAAGFDSVQEYLSDWRSYNWDSDADSSTDVGTPTLAPWVIDEVHDDQILAKRNPYFWAIDKENKQLPYIDEIVIKESGNMGYFNPNPEDVLIARAPVVAWESYPSGFFLDKGEEIATLSVGNTYTVVERAILSSLLSGDRYYLQISPVGGSPNNPCVTQDCWVFQGNDRSADPANLIPPNIVLER